MEPNECLILVDFSENFTFVVQDEIQSYHWVNAQAALHPFVIYYNDNNELQTKSICVINDYLSHSTVAVYAFQKEVLHIVKSVIHNVEKIITLQMVL